MVHARWIMYLEVSNPNETADHRLWFVARPPPLAALTAPLGRFRRRSASVGSPWRHCVRAAALASRGKNWVSGNRRILRLRFLSRFVRWVEWWAGGELSEWKRVWDFWWNFWVGDLSRIKQFRRVILVWRDGIWIFKIFYRSFWI